MATHKLIHKGFTGSYEVSLEDGCLIGRVLFIDDIVTYEGETVAELKVNFCSAVDRYLAYCRNTGTPANKPYSGTFNVRVGPELHRKAAAAAHVAGMNLNEYVSSAISFALAKEGVTHVEHNHHHVITIEENSLGQKWKGIFASQGTENYSGTTIQ